MMSRACFFVPHPDDETLSMWPALHLLAAGYTVHFVFMSRGGVTPEAVRLNGVDPTGTPSVCSLPDHAYVHKPADEQYAPLTQADMGPIRLREGYSAAAIMGRIAPTNPATPGHVICHDENLPLEWGNGSGHGDPTAEGIQAAEDIIRRYVEDLPNTFFYTMSPTDDHPDHAACGKALRNLKGDPTRGIAGDPVLASELVNAMFFVSKLYWGSATTPRPADVLAEKCAWYPNIYPNNTASLPRMPEYSTYLRNKVIRPYVSSWCSADQTVEVGQEAAISRGTFCVGGHQVYSQFYNAIINPSIAISALWHP